MKTTVIIFSVIGMLAIGGCNQKTNTKAILDSPDSRKELFSTIADDHDLMMEFLESMHGNNQAMQIMQGDTKMMGSMMNENSMKTMMQDSTMSNNLTQGMMGNHAMMQSMMSKMMKDPKMMQSMMQMMNQHGMMSKDCMQSGMKMMGTMGSNGMDIKHMDGMTNENNK